MIDDFDDLQEDDDIEEEGFDGASFVTLDLDADTVGQCIKLTKSLFQRLNSDELEPVNEGKSDIIISITACDFTAKDRFPHLWKYILRSVKDFVKSPDINIIIIYVGDSDQFKNVIVWDLQSKDFPKNLSVATPSYITSSTSLDIAPLVINKLLTII